MLSPCLGGSPASCWNVSGRRLPAPAPLAATLQRADNICAGMLQIRLTRENTLQRLTTPSIGSRAPATLIPVIAAAADRTERDRRIPDDVIAAHRRRRGSSHAAAGDARRRRSRRRHIQPGDRDDRGGGCQHRLVPRAVARELAFRRLSRSKSRCARCSARPEAIVAWGPPGGLTKAQVVDGGYARHRQVALRQRQRQCHLDGRPFAVYRARRQRRASMPPAGLSCAP